MAWVDLRSAHHRLRTATARLGRWLFFIGSSSSRTPERTLMRYTVALLIALLHTTAVAAQPTHPAADLPSGLTIGARVRVWSPELERPRHDAVLAAWAFDSV